MTGNTEKKIAEDDDFSVAKKSIQNKKKNQFFDNPMKNIQKQTSKMLNETGKAIDQGVKQTIKASQRIIEPVGDIVQTGVKETGKTIDKLTKPVYKPLQQGSKELVQQTIQLLTNTGNYIQEHGVQVLAASMLIGLTTVQVMAKKTKKYLKK